MNATVSQISSQRRAEERPIMLMMPLFMSPPVAPARGPRPRLRRGLTGSSDCILITPAEGRRSRSLVAASEEEDEMEVIV